MRRKVNPLHPHYLKIGSFRRTGVLNSHPKRAISRTRTLRPRPMPTSASTPMTENEQAGRGCPARLRGAAPQQLSMCGKTMRHWPKRPRHIEGVQRSGGLVLALQVIAGAVHFDGALALDILRPPVVRDQSFARSAQIVDG